MLCYFYTNPTPTESWTEQTTNTTPQEVLKLLTPPQNNKQKVHFVIIGPSDMTNQEIGTMVSIKRQLSKVDIQDDLDTSEVTPVVWWELRSREHMSECLLFLFKSYKNKNPLFMVGGKSVYGEYLAVSVWCKTL